MYGYDVQLRPMPLGYAGTIYNCNLSMLQDLGLQRTVAIGVLKKLHTHAILCLHNIIKERRYLENNGRYALQARKQEEQRGGLEQPQHLSIPGQPGIILGFSLN